MAVRKIISLAVFLLAVLIGSGAQADEKRIALQSVQSGLYVRAGLTQQSLLAAVSPHVQEWETFRVVPQDGAIVALQSIQSNKYVRAGVGEDSRLAAVSSQVSGWEKFRWIERGNGKIALQSVQNGKFVRAGWTRDGYLAAVSSEIKEWETFRLIDPAGRGSIAGRIRESGSRHLLRYLGLSLYDSNGNYLRDRGVVPDSQGNYRFSSLSYGHYIVKVTPAGKADPLYASEPKEHRVDCNGSVSGVDFSVR